MADGFGVGLAATRTVECVDAAGEGVDAAREGAAVVVRAAGDVLDGTTEGVSVSGGVLRGAEVVADVVGRAVVAGSGENAGCLPRGTEPDAVPLRWCAVDVDGAAFAMLMATTAQPAATRNAVSVVRKRPQLMFPV